MDEQAEALAHYLKVYHDNHAVGITKERYLLMCEQLGEPVDYEKMPVDASDLPYYVHLAYEIFGRLPDIRVGMDAVFAGKDLTSLPVFFDVYEIDCPSDRKRILDSISLINNRAIRDSNKKSKKPKK